VTDDIQTLSQQILDTIPLVMRTVSAGLRQSNHIAVTAHFRVLWILQHGPLSLSELAEKQFVSLPTMSNSISILEERGWIRRTRSTQDRRKVVIEIAPAGLAVLAEARHEMEARVTTIISSLSADEREQVAQGLNILRDTFHHAIEADCNRKEE
jgi:DNA-binding MarR family transcriptional regulator